MEVNARIKVIEAQLHSQKRIKEQFEKEGNELGAALASRQIKKLNAELRRLK